MLSRGCADDPRVAEIVADALPDGRGDIPLRLFAGVHYLELEGRAPRYAQLLDPWPVFGSILEEHRDWLRDFVREHPVQTNEVQRSWTLLPGFVTAIRRAGERVVDLIELGPSAGLNLLWDRYRYRYAQGEWGPRFAALRLEGEERREVPGQLLDTDVEVRRRVGIDRSPVDVRTEHGARLVEAFVWADDPLRLARARQAIGVARRDPPRLVQGDFVDLLPSLLADRDRDVLTIVFDSNSTEYLGSRRFLELSASISRGRSGGRLAWLSMELPREKSPRAYVLELQQWPDGRRRRLAEVHYHGAGLRWLE